MKFIKAFIFSYVLVFLFLSSCSPEKKSPPSAASPLSSETASPAVLTASRGAKTEGFLVTDEQNQPLRAKILIGAKWGSPFEGNFISTNNQGRADLPPKWTDPQSVTIDAPGYIRLTLLDQAPQALRIQLQRVPEARLQLQGNSTGFPVKDFDQKVDFGLLLTSLSKSDVFTFTPDKIISPVTDKLSIAGQSFELPSNVTLPRQRETYILPVTLDKSQYRMFYTHEGKQNVFMARGQFPLKDVVDGFQSKKEVFELINFFSIQGGQLREVYLKNSVTKEDFQVSDFTFKEKIRYKAPLFSDKEVLIVISAAEKNQAYLPADVKRFTSGETLSLNLFAQQKNILLGLLKNKNEFKSGSEGIDRFSAHLIHSPPSTMRFIPMIDNPEVINTQSFRFVPPQLDTGNYPLGMSVLISSRSSEPSKFASFDGRTQIPRWELRALTWNTSLTLPEWPEAFSQVDVFAASQKIQVSFVATTRSFEANSWNEVLDSATHVSHASKNY